MSNPLHDRCGNFFLKKHLVENRHLVLINRVIPIVPSKMAFSIPSPQSKILLLINAL